MNHGKNFRFYGVGTSVTVGLVMVLVVRVLQKFRILLQNMLDTDVKIDAEEVVW